MSKLFRFSPEDSDLASESWYVDSKGYVRRNICGTIAGKRTTVLRAAHRVVLARIVGRELTRLDVCDHINGDRTDNRRENLRLVTQCRNCQHKPGLGRYRGTSFHRGAGKWQASVKARYLGLFANRDDAAAAAENARRELGFLSKEAA